MGCFLISFCLGNTSFPPWNSFLCHLNFLRQLLLCHTFFYALLSNILSYFFLFHRPLQIWLFSCTLSIILIFEQKCTLCCVGIGIFSVISFIYGIFWFSSLNLRHDYCIFDYLWCILADKCQLIHNEIFISFIYFIVNIVYNYDKFLIGRTNNYI